MLGSAFAGGEKSACGDRSGGVLGFGACFMAAREVGGAPARLRLEKSSAELLRGSSDGVRARGEDLQGTN